MRGKAMRWNQIKSSKAVMERGAAPLCLILLVMALVCGQKAEAQANGGVASIVTEEIFNQIVAPNSSSCEGSGFYTTYSTFIDVANNFSGFGTSSSDDVNRREIAAFFGNTAHETIGFCYINEINPGSDYCDTSNTTYPCVSGKKYYGRGPIQLSWNFNYGPAGQYFNFDGLGDPDTVARDAKISYGTAVWYWMVQSSCHKDITSGQGFGATINDINGAIECNGGNSNAVQSRVNYYKKFCQLLGVDPGSNLTC